MSDIEVILDGEGEIFPGFTTLGRIKTGNDFGTLLQSDKTGCFLMYRDRVFKRLDSRKVLDKMSEVLFK